MVNPKVVVGECSIQVMLRGELVMSIPHRMWESGTDERGEVMWSGELRGESTTLSLVTYLQGRITGCEGRKDLVTRLWEVLEELRSPVWGKTFREEQIEKRKKRGERDIEEREADQGKAATAEQRNKPEAQGIEEVLDETEWSRAA